MFSGCNNLTELNSTRSKLISELLPEQSDLIEKTQEINNAYNARRKEILSAKATPYKQFESTRYPRQTRVQYSSVPILGVSSKPGTIEMTRQGFLI